MTVADAFFILALLGCAAIGFVFLYVAVKE